MKMTADQQYIEGTELVLRPTPMALHIKPSTAAEADLGMFGRTGAPTKMGPPHEDQKNFCNVPTHRNCLC